MPRYIIKMKRVVEVTAEIERHGSISELRHRLKENQDGLLDDFIQEGMIDSDTITVKSVKQAPEDQAIRHIDQERNSPEDSRR